MAILSSEEVKMTSILEKAIRVIAPHRCLSCGNYDNVICTACVHHMRRIEVPLCALCGTPSAGWRACSHHKSQLSGVFVAAPYEDTIAEVIKQFKFSHVREAYQPLAHHIARNLPSLDESWSVLAVPTVASRIRGRGYDHAALLAREVARLVRRPLIRPVGRLRDHRQVGASRAQRAAQSQAAFVVIKPSAVAGRRMLVVDDVCTTGATLSAVATVLMAAGAREVWAAVVARKE